MKAPGLPPGFKELTVRDGRRFHEVAMVCTDLAEFQAQANRLCVCQHRPMFGRFIWRRSTKYVSGIDWQCLSCYERQRAHLKIKDFMQYVTVIEDRRCEDCLGVGCEKCKKIQCGYVGCTSFVQVEHHHYAPFEFFGPEAELYPVLPLCHEHHEHWHKVIDARIKYKYD